MNLDVVVVVVLQINQVREAKSKLRHLPELTFRSFLLWVLDSSEDLIKVGIKKAFDTQIWNSTDEFNTAYSCILKISFLGCLEVG